MPFLPIAERELRVAARRRSTYRIRFWAVTAGSIVFGWRCLQMVQQQTSHAAQGHELFLTLVILGFTFALLSGAYTTSDSLSAEKREGTMGLLFLTDLKSYDIVLGKLVASSLSAAYGLVAIIPMLAVPILLGGVSMMDFMHAVIAIGSALFLSLASGLVASTHNRNERKATFFTALILLIVMFVPYASPGYLLLPIFLGARVTSGLFWPSVCAVWGCTLLFLAWVSLRLPGSWQDKVSTKKLRVETQVAHIGREKTRSQRSRKWLEINPFLWISFRDGKKQFHAWLFLTAMITIWLLSYFSWKDVMFDSMMTGPLVVILNGFLKIWIVTEACQQLIEARRSGALELLLSTPLTDRDIIRGQWHALRRQFGLPLLILGVLEIILIFKGERNTSFFTAAVLSLPLDFLALGWAGMWLGLTARNTTRAISKAVMLVMLLPWIVFYLSSLGLDLAVQHISISVSAELVRLWTGIYWSVLSLVAAYFVGFQWARKNLLRKFRLIATEQYQSRNKEE
ncbi:MAG: hypothetical protein JWM68_4628 [Verrucomicrobiales bacterium]|nr:hypothetical protein [Verrucomicrobiales bacterium]